MEKALEEYKPRERAMSYSHTRRKSVFEEIFNEEQFFKFIARGSPEDIEEIDRLMSKGLSANLFDPSDENSAANRPNRIGHTPLYIASHNGHEEVIKHLLKFHANPMLKSKASEYEEESNLTVASRWKHAKVVQLYLELFDWPLEELKKAKVVAGTKEIKDMIAEKMAKMKGSSCCFCCCPTKKSSKPK